MDEKFIVFRGGPSRAGRKRTKVTLNSRGVFFMNPVAVAALGTAASVLLLYDPDKQVIGLQPARSPQPNTFPVRRRENDGNFVINAVSFIKHFDIKVIRTIEFNHPRTGPDGILRLRLTDTTIIGREPKLPS